MKKLLILITCVAVFTQCKKEKPKDPEPVPSAYTAPTGSITGKVTQYDQYNNTYTVGLNNTTVSLFGTSYSTVTDALGHYTLTNIPQGIYSIATDKPGCGTYQTQQISFVGNGTLYHDSYTCDKATYTFNSGSVIDSVGNLLITVNLNPVNNPLGVIVIYGTSGNLNLSDPNSYSALLQYSIPANKSTYRKQDNFSNLPSGLIYAKIYPSPYYTSGSMYHDVPSGKNYYVSYGTPIATTYTFTNP